MCHVYIVMFWTFLSEYYCHKVFMCNSPSSIQIRHINTMCWKLGGGEVRKTVKNHEYFSTLSEYQGMPKTKFPRHFYHKYVCHGGGMWSWFFEKIFKISRFLYLRICSKKFEIFFLLWYVFNIFEIFQIINIFWPVDIICIDV